MNAFNDVNLASACIVTSTELAERMGISCDKWIFPLGGGRAQDSEDCIVYPFTSSSSSSSSPPPFGQRTDMFSSLESAQLLLQSCDCHGFGRMPPRSGTTQRGH